MYLHVYEDNASCSHTVPEHVFDICCFICNATELFLKAETFPVSDSASGFDVLI